MRRLILIGFLSLVPWMGEACTTAIVRAEASASGRPLLWKQRDTERQGNALRHFKGERYAFTGLVDEGHEAEVWDGANETGFIIANNLSYNLRPDSLSGRKMTAGIIMKKALGCCATVDEFEALLAAMPEPRYVSANFAVVDAVGGAAYIECWDYGYRRYDVPESGMAFRTNYSYSGFPKHGRGYGRHDLMENLTTLHGPTGYTPEWFFGVGRQIPIARPTTTSCLVFEGGKDVTIWAAPGYTPACYPVAAWVKAGDELPACLRSGEGMFRAARLLQEGRTPTDFARSIIPRMEKAQRTEFRQGRRAEKRGTLEAIRKYNTEADRRFHSYYTE